MKKFLRALASVGTTTAGVVLGIVPGAGEAYSYFSGGAFDLSSFLTHVAIGVIGVLAKDGWKTGGIKE